MKTTTLATICLQPAFGFPKADRKKTISPTLVLLFTICLLSSKAQISESLVNSAAKQLSDRDVRLLYTARDKFNNNFYSNAVAIVDSIPVKDLVPLNFIKGIFYSYEEDTKKKGLQLIKSVVADSSKLDNYFYHKAFALSRVDSFAAAIDCYQVALAHEQVKKQKNKKLIDNMEVRIEQCRNILAMRNRKNTVQIANIGPPINTDFSEYCPIITSNENLMVFTYRGPRSTGGKQTIEAGLLHHKKVELFFEDIFVSRKINDTLWSNPERIPNLDTPEHDAAVSINSDGTEMFVYKNIGKGNGDLYLTRYKGNNWSKPVKQIGLNSEAWDGSACFVPNSKKIIISSERKGGYGGKDLYYAERTGDNAWGNITNLGPSINTKYDEDAPFVTTDGNILFFSTNNHSSLGGYDIERSDLVNGFWSKPYNLGPPINTPNDDEYFTVRADGRVAYYSSSQKNGKGGQDIYVVRPGIPGKPVAMLQVEGLVTVDGKPVEAEIELRSLDKNPTLDFFVNANGVTGKFLCNLPSKDEYELTIHTPKFPPQIISLNTNDIDSFVVLNVFSEFYSPEHGEEEHIHNAKEATIHHYEEVEKEMLHKFGDLRREDVTYKVQIGAYRFPKQFDYNHFIGLPKIDKQLDSLGISHFTCGNFHTYVEAHTLLDKVRKNLPDAFVVVYNRGRRVTLVNHLSDLKK